MTRLFVFIDASNIWAAQKSKKKLFDFSKLKNHIEKEYQVSDKNLHIFYYVAYPDIGTRKYDISVKHNFFVFLKKRLSFIVVKKPLKRIKAQDDKGNNFVMEKGNMDVEITIDAIHNIKEYDLAILFTGDSDFLPLIKYIQKTGKKVYIYSSRNNVSTELRIGANKYIDILRVKDDIWGKKLKHKDKK